MLLSIVFSLDDLRQVFTHFFKAKRGEDEFYGVIDWMFASPPNSYVGALMPNVAIFRDGVFEEVIKKLS